LPPDLAGQDGCTGFVLCSKRLSMTKPSSSSSSLLLLLLLLFLAYATKRLQKEKSRHSSPLSLSSAPLITVERARM